MGKKIFSTFKFGLKMALGAALVSYFWLYVVIMSIIFIYYAHIGQLNVIFEDPEGFLEAFESFATLFGLFFLMGCLIYINNFTIKFIDSGFQYGFFKYKLYYKEITYIDIKAIPFVPYITINTNKKLNPNGKSKKTCTLTILYLNYFEMKQSLDNLKLTEYLSDKAKNKLDKKSARKNHLL